jgi:hypothetical protein
MKTHEPKRLKPYILNIQINVLPIVCLADNKNEGETQALNSLLISEIIFLPNKKVFF